MNSSRVKTGVSGKVAVVGTGISGLTAAYLLSKRYQLTVYEKNNYIGGHTNTVPLMISDKKFNVDTGFIVCNNRNYPNFLRLMDIIGVKLQKTQMSFSVRNNELDLEYNGHTLNTLFSQRRNLLRPDFYRLILDILKFNKNARLAYHSYQRADENPGKSNKGNTTLGEFVNELNLSSLFLYNYLLPMIAAIWSCNLKQAGDVPLRFFLNFFHHHGLLEVKNRPQWYVLENGSSSYINALSKNYKANIKLNCPVKSVHRTGSGVEITTDETKEVFDDVVIACHSDQALNLLANPTAIETSVLGEIRYQKNSVVLHSDVSIMPKRKRSWASWNFLSVDSSEKNPKIVTYCMNILQGLKSDTPILVSLNAKDKIDPEKIWQEFSYDHPLFTKTAIAAQKNRHLVSGKDRIHFCGAYWYNGFHEDGVRSALDVCSDFGLSL